MSSKSNFSTPHLRVKSRRARRLALTTLAALLVVSTSGLLAQQATSTPAPAFLLTTPALQSALSAPDSSSAPLTFSSSDNTNAADAKSFFGLAAGSQPPPRRRYGRPNYHDRLHNADGSSKYTFLVGVGAATPIRDTKNYLTTSYKLQGGVGYNFNRTFSLVLQFDYDHFGLQSSQINAQRNLYLSLGLKDSTGNPIDLRGLDANAHIYSLTLNPVINVLTSDSFGAYLVGGGGYFHKAVSFTLPQQSVSCDQFGQCFQIQSNQDFDTYKDNSFGGTGGVGITYKPGKFAPEKFFVEVRYAYVANQPRAASNSNLYPPAYLHTEYLPVTIGLRF